MDNMFFFHPYNLKAIFIYLKSRRNGNSLRNLRYSAKVSKKVIAIN